MEWRECPVPGRCGYKGPHLRVEHVFPPIPDRRYDYCAYLDGDEEKREYGWGPTAEDAIKDWQENYEEND